MEQTQNRSDIVFSSTEDIPRQSASRIQKSSSLRENCRSKRSSVRRKVHTVPSDKDENQQIEKFRRECLSKAIQWNMVDLIKHHKQAQLDDLGEYLAHEDLEELSKKVPDRKTKFRLFLPILMQKSFEAMRKWLTNSGVDNAVLKKVWETYNEFSNKETNQRVMKCFPCRLSSTFHVNVVADHLFSAGIIDMNLYKRAIITEIPIGIQMTLWNEILDQCKVYCHSSNVVNAIRIALTDTVEENGELEADVDSLLSEIDQCKDFPEKLFTCYCPKKCNKALHPVSCVQTMPVDLSQVYFRKPSLRHKDIKVDSDTNNCTESSADSDSPFDSTVKSNSEDTGAEADCESMGSSLSSVSSSPEADVSVLKNTLAVALDRRDKQELGTSRSFQINPIYRTDETDPQTNCTQLAMIRGKVKQLYRADEVRPAKQPGPRTDGPVFICKNAYIGSSNYYTSVTN